MGWLTKCAASQRMQSALNHREVSSVFLLLASSHFATGTVPHKQRSLRCYCFVGVYLTVELRRQIQLHISAVGVVSTQKNTHWVNFLPCCAMVITIPLACASLSVLLLSKGDALQAAYEAGSHSVGSLIKQAGVFCISLHLSLVTDNVIRKLNTEESCSKCGQHF